MVQVSVFPLKKIDISNGKQRLILKGSFQSNAISGDLEIIKPSVSLRVIYLKIRKPNDTNRLDVLPTILF